MFGKAKQNQKLDLLQRSIDKLAKTLQDGNIHESIYMLGSKKEIIRRNLLAGIARGIGSRYRIYNNYCYYNLFFTKNSKIKYTYYWKIYK